MNAPVATGGTVTTVMQSIPSPPLLPKCVLVATALVRGDHKPCVGLRIGKRAEVVFAHAAVKFAHEILTAVAQAKGLEHALQDRELVAKLLDSHVRTAYHAGWQAYGQVLANGKTKGDP